jgi:hypothetical protein
LDITKKAAKGGAPPAAGQAIKLAKTFREVERAAKQAVKLYSRNCLRHGTIGIS